MTMMIEVMLFCLTSFLASMGLIMAMYAVLTNASVIENGLKRHEENVFSDSSNSNSDLVTVDLVAKKTL